MKNIQAARETLDATLADAGRAGGLAGLSSSIERLEKLFRAAEGDTENPLQFGDETLNWCAAEVAPHFESALWSLSAGYYPTSLMAAARGLHIGTAALVYFVNDVELARSTDARVSPTFEKWEGGAGLPTISGLADWLDSRASGRPDLRGDVREPGDQLRYLVGEYENPGRHHHLQRGFPAPGFHQQGHAMATSALQEAMETVAALWILELPHLRGDALFDGLLTLPWSAAVRRSVSR
ncbi:MAG: hypothetical protein EXR76_09645 [Myxococcales bacterium]|nr:hypothetical protein [Myxococcales bacterium]